MKKILPVVVALLAVVAFVVLSNLSEIGYVQQNGYAVSSNTDVKRILVDGTIDDPEQLTEVIQDQIIYSRVGKYYLGDERIPIDLQYPMYINGGTALRFYDDTHYLVTNTVELLSSFEGLYVSNGITYAEDGWQVDSDEFILVSLNNGLFMNAQDMEIITRVGEQKVPVNSILYCTDSFIRWFSYNDGYLVYGEEEIVFDAMIRIGDNEYSYEDLLKALGLLSDAVNKLNNNKSPDEELNQAQDIIAPEGDIDNTGISSKSNNSQNKNSNSDIKKTNGSDINEDDSNSGKKPGNTQTGNDSGESSGYTPSSEEISQGDDSSSDNNGSSGDSTENDENSTSEYIPPIISIEDIDAWSYAIHFKLKIEDTTGSLLRGVRVTVFKADGKTVLMRKSLNMAGEFNLYTLPPDTEMKIQYTYRYFNMVDTVDKDGNIVTKTVRESYTSDLIPVKTKALDEVSIYPLEVEWLDVVGQNPNRINFKSLKTSNTSDYIVGDDSWQNFKLNTLNYLTNLTVTLVDTNTKEKVNVNINAATMLKATQEKGTDYLSSMALQSNSKYQYIVRGYDKYGNELELISTGHANEKGEIEGIWYTSKQEPSATITQISNVSGSLKIKISVSDPDQAINSDAAILSCANINKENVNLSGTMGGKEFSTDYLSLELDDNNSTLITMTSLPFARTFTFSLAGTYNTTCDYSTENNKDVTDTICSAKIYTADLPSGTISWTSSITNLADTQADINIRMEEKGTSKEILPLIDYFRISVIRMSTETKTATFDLREDVLSKYSPDDYTALNDAGYTVTTAGDMTTIVLQQGNEALKINQIELVGDFTGFDTLWDALLAGLTPNEDSASSRVPVTMRILVGKDVLKSRTNYNIKINGMVEKSGETYTIPSILSTSNFITLKKMPAVSCDDIFIASDILEFLNFKVNDPDGAVIGDGQLLVNLYSGSSILASHKINVNETIDSIKFTGLIAGSEYVIKIIAPSFNNGETYATYHSNYEIKSYTVVGGSDLFGALNLSALDYTSVTSSGTILDYGELTRGTTPASTNLTAVSTNAIYCSTGAIEISQDMIYRVANYAPQNGTTGVAYGTTSLISYFYDASGKYLGSATSTAAYGSAAIYPQQYATAKYVRLALSQIWMDTYGATITGYKVTDDIVKKYPRYLNKDGYRTGSETITSSTTVMCFDKYPVTPGQVYFRNAYGSNTTIYMYNKDGSYVGTMSSATINTFVIPTNCYYISLNYNVTNTGCLYLLADVDESTGFSAVIDLTAKDVKGYLATGNKTPVVTLDLYNSESSVNPEYKVYQSRQLTLEKSATGGYLLEDTIDFSGLPENTSWKLTMSVVYQGKTIELANITFHTDGAYQLITCNEDMAKLTYNPYGNYLVVNDFENNINSAYNVYGSIDFQGHIITRNTQMTSRFLSTVGTGATVKNLVFEFNGNQTITAGVMSTLSGTAENIIVRTKSGVIVNGTGIVVTSISADGKLKNFIVKLGGDTYIQDGYTNGIVASSSYGNISDGYIYASNGSRVIIQRGSYTSASISGGVVAYLSTTGVMDRVFCIYDTYIEDDTNFGSMLGNNASAIQRNCYQVGDFYIYKKSEGITKTNRSTTDRIVGSKAGYSDNIYYVTQNTYTAKTATFADPSLLYETYWQQNALGGGNFDIDSCVLMGYYPRLVFPTEMAKYQEYLPLPVLSSAATPQVVDAKLTEGVSSVDKDTSAYVTFYVTNNKHMKITGININNLNVNIIDQGTMDSGLYWVSALVSVNPEDPGYFSTYHVNSITAVSGAATNTYTNNYDIKIPFYKAVANAADWQDINSHMTWNYHVVADIDFSKQSLGNVIINGSKTSETSTASFTGIIDGGIYDDNGKLIGMHALENISIQNSRYAYVIYNLSNGTVSNLVVDNMKLVGSATLGGYTGFIRNASGTDGTINNIHITNGLVSGYQYVGSIVAYSAMGMYNCSASNTVISDLPSSVALNLGGLVGYTNRSNNNCYTRNVDITVNNSTAVTGVGGLIGYSYGSNISDCYTHGTITSTASKVGGLVGYKYSRPMTRCFTYVTIDTSGDLAGGIVGTEAQSNGDYAFGMLSVGDIYTTGASNVHRISGSAKYKASVNLYRNYAYSKQLVTGVPSGDVSDAFQTIAGTELAKASTWTDTIGFTSQWSYSSLKDGCFPKLYYFGTNTLLYGQEDIMMPGQGAEQELELIDAGSTIVEGKDQYYLQATLLHPGYKWDKDINGNWVLKDSTGKSYSVKLELDGLDISQASQEQKHSIVEITPLSPEVGIESTYIEIAVTNDAIRKALDMYRLTVSLASQSNSVTVDYGKPMYWEVPNLEAWNSLMEDGHGNTQENFMIIGTVDFGRKTTAYTNLRINRLEGKSIDGSNGFKGLRYACDTMGNAWIESVAQNVSNIIFEDISVDFTKASTARGASGVIVYCGGLVDKVTINNCYLYVNYNSRANVGFFGSTDSKLSNIEINGMTIEDSQNNTSVRSYGGGLVGYTYGSLNNINASNVTVSLQYTSYVGGIAGYVAGTAPGITYNYGTIKDATVKGNTTTGGFQGYCAGGTNGSTADKRGLTAINCNVSSFTVTAGGIIGSLGTVNTYYSSAINCKVSNNTYTGTAGTGGLIGNTGAWSTVNDCKANGCTVTGGPYVGGLIGLRMGYNTFSSSVIDTKVTGTNTAAGVGGAGGMFGYATTRDTSYSLYNLVVRDVDVIADANAGGLIGYTPAEVESVIIKNAYVAEDVYVTSKSNNAGGIIGSMGRGQLSYIACGATVTANANNAGGIIGQITNESADSMRSMSQIYYCGRVTASGDYAAGVVGNVSGSLLSLNGDKYKSMVVAAEVTAAGGHGSIWANSTSYGGAGNIKNFVAWQYSKINGQFLKSILDVVEDGKVTTAVPTGSVTYAASDFKSGVSFTTAGFDDYWDYSSLGNDFMPYVLSTTKANLNFEKGYAKDNDIYDTSENMGIPLPHDDSAPNEIVVYASGVDTINIEFIEAPLAAIVNGEVYNFEGNVLTLKCGLDKDISVNGNNVFLSTNMRRTVMTYGDYWYYIDSNGAIVSSAWIDTPFAGSGKFIHMWQGKAIDNKGNVYDLSSKSITSSVVGTEKTETKPFYSFTISGKKVDVFYNYSIYDKKVVQQRMFALGNTIYSVSPLQNAVYDGVILSANTGINRNYFALLENNGNIINYGTALRTGGAANSGIHHMTNNMGYTGTIVLLRYTNGSVIGFDYNSGIVVCSTAAETQGIMSYLSNNINGLVSEFSDWNGEIEENTNFTSTESYLGQIEGLANKYPQLPNLLENNGGDTVAISNTVSIQNNEVIYINGIGYYLNNGIFSTDNGVVYIDGTAVYRDGQQISVNNGVLTVDGKAISPIIQSQNANKESSGLGQGNAGSSTRTAGNGKTENAANLGSNTGGDSCQYAVSYNEETGEYDVYTVGQLVNSADPKTVEKQMEELSDEGKFVLNDNLTMNIAESERSGMVLIVLTIVGLSVLSIALYVSVSNKKNRNNKR